MIKTWQRRQIGGSDMSRPLEEVTAEVLAKNPAAPKQFPIQYFNNRTRSAAKLLNNADAANYLEGRNHAYTITLKEPVFINQIEVTVSGYGKNKRMEFGWTPQRSGSAKSKSVQISENVFVVVINDVVTSFYVKPPKQAVLDPKLHSIRVYGLTLYELDDALGELADRDGLVDETREIVRGLVAEAATAEQTVQNMTEMQSELQSAIDALEEEKESAETEALEATQALEALERRLSQLRNDESELAGRLESASDTLEKTRNSLSELNRQVVEERRELKRLKDDVNMFPSELSGYLQQGSKSIKDYSFLALLPLVLLGLFVVVLFSNAVDLSVVLREHPDVEIWTVILSRIPFAIISIFVITACYKISKVFITEIIRIANRRLDLTRVSIVAKDVSDAASHGLELSGEELYELRTKLKMDMLKSHLKGYVSDDYQYDMGGTFLEHITEKLSMQKPVKKKTEAK